VGICVGFEFSWFGYLWCFRCITNCMWVLWKFWGFWVLVFLWVRYFGFCCSFVWLCVSLVFLWVLDVWGWYNAGVWFLWFVGIVLVCVLCGGFLGLCFVICFSCCFWFGI